MADRVEIKPNCGKNLHMQQLSYFESELIIKNFLSLFPHVLIKPVLKISQLSCYSRFSSLHLILDFLFSGICLDSISLKQSAKQMNSMENKKIQQEIIGILKDKKECELGYMVSELEYSYNQILQNVMQLIKEGKILKLVGHKGYFSLNNN